MAKPVTSTSVTANELNCISLAIDTNLLLADKSEKIAALEDLVESGDNLLRTVDSLLKDIQTLGDIDIDSKHSLICASYIFVNL